MKKMKIFLAGLTVLMMFSANVSAQTVDQRVSAFERDISALEIEKKAIAAEETTLEIENQQLISIAKNIKEIGAKLERDQRKLNIDSAKYESDLNQLYADAEKHNSWKPNPKDRGAVNSYNTEKEQLESRYKNLKSIKADLKRRSDDQDLIKNGLESSRKKENERVLAWTAKKKNLNSKMVEFEKKLAALKKQYVDICRELLKDPKTKKEALRFKCGNVPFDGADPNLPTLEDLGINSPSFGGNSSSDIKPPTGLTVPAAPKGLKIIK